MNRRLALVWAGGVALSSLGCTKAPPEPVKLVVATPDAGAPDAAEVVDAAAAPEPEMRFADGGVMSPGAAMGWDLDPEDPARDYVRRYVKATKRYDDKSDCVVVGKGVDKGGKQSVEVRENPPKCGTANTVRDVFYVDVVKDRLTVDDPAKRAPLAPWPDGSKPDEKAAPVSVIESIRDWRTPMADTFDTLRLSPIRIQGYGRGTYTVVTLSGWREPLARNASDAKLREAVKKLCTANENHSFAVAAGFNDPVWLRAKCPDASYKWVVR